MKISHVTLNSNLWVSHLRQVSWLLIRAYVRTLHTSLTLQIVSVIKLLTSRRRWNYVIKSLYRALSTRVKHAQLPLYLGTGISWPVNRWRSDHRRSRRRDNFVLANENCNVPKRLPAWVVQRGSIFRAANLATSIAARNSALGHSSATFSPAGKPPIPHYPKPSKSRFHQDLHSAASLQPPCVFPCQYCVLVIMFMSAPQGAIKSSSPWQR